MLNTRRPEIAARDYSSTEEAAFITWAEGIKGSKSNQPKSGPWSRRTTTQIYGEEEFQWSDKPPVDESDVLSPKLWEPTSRAEAIAGFRQEMMDLVKDVPESAYELSLKDLVEMPRVGRERGEIAIHEEEAEKGRAQVKKGVKRSMSRSESLDSGVFLLKMFLPFSFAGNRSKSCGGGGGGGGGSKVSPRPAGGKREYGDRSSSSGSSEGSIIRYGSRKMTGCFPFLSCKSKARRI